MNETKPEPKTLGPDAVAGKTTREKKPQGDLTRSDRAEIVKQIKTETTSVMNPVEYQQMKMLANDFIESGSVPSSFQNASQVLMALQAGKEMGMQPVEAMQSFYIVNGLLNVWGKAIPRRLREHDYLLSYKDETPESCTAVIAKRDGTEMYEETLTFKEAQESGYTVANGSLKVGWKPGVNRKLKLRYGALSILIKTYLPEVLGSVSDIVEVSQDYGPVANKVDPETTINKALAKREGLEETDSKPVEQEQDDDA